MIKTNRVTAVTTLALGLVLASSAFALQHSAMSAADMQTMMYQCAQLQQQMQQKRGAMPSADMQRRMA